MITCFSAYFFERKNVFLSKNNSNIKKIIAVIIIFFPLIYISGQRLNVGTDYWSYYTLTNTYGKLSVLEYIVQFQGKEIGFYFLCRLVYLFNIREFIFYIIPIIICYFLFKFYLLNKENLNLFSLILIFCTFFFPKTLNISRQMIATFILLYAFNFINKDIKKYIIYSLVAISFHTTAILGIVLLPFFYLNKVKGRTIRVAINVMYILSVFMFILMFQTKLMDSFYESSIQLTQGSNGLQLILQLIPLVFIIFFQKKFNINDENFMQHIYIYIAAILFFTVFSRYPWGFRISYYFIISIMYLVPYIWKCLKRNTMSNLFIKLIIVLFNVAQFVLLYGILKYDSIFPFCFK